MRLKNLVIKNFRALANIEAEFDTSVSVIVGPNASGKTTILEAIRLAKAALAQRTQNEGQQTLISLGAMSPHIPQQLIAEGLVSDPAKNLEIRCGYQLSESEVQQLNSQKAQLVTGLVQSRVGALNPASFGAFLSSPAGQSALQAAEVELTEGSDTVGLFARAGIANGSIEPYDFTDIDRTVSAGISIDGKGWRRNGDTVGIAVAVNDISKAHERYLAAGGLGTLVGDGRLPHPGPEAIGEVYYAWKPLKPLSVTLDYQIVGNPGYNRDRGPVHVFGLRLHGQF